MNQALARINKIKEVKSKLRQIFNNKSKTILTHYSCESFIENTKGSHKITSIAVRYLDSAQTRSFSIFQFAEELKKESCIDEYFEEIEKKLLESFFQFVKEHSNYFWVHWNMRDINYGFSALEHRFEILGGTPHIIQDNSKYDLSRILHQRFGKNYAPHPRLEKIMEMNEITSKNFLTGGEEADAFKEKKYLKLHQSTLRKVDIFDCILSRLEEDNLNVATSNKEIYGNCIVGYIEKTFKHWLFKLLIIIITFFGFFKLVIFFTNF